MSIVTLANLKSRFETGDIPVGADFVDLIDTLGSIIQVGAYAVGPDQSGNERGAYAIDLQTGRSAVDQVAAAAQSIAIGYGNKVNGNYGIGIGSGAVDVENAIAIGKAAAVSPDSLPGSIAIGANAKVEIYEGVAIGFGAYTGKYETYFYSYGGGVAIGPRAKVLPGYQTTKGVAIGVDSHSFYGGIAIGENSYAKNFRAVAIGKLAQATNYGVSIGAGKVGSRAVGIGCNSGDYNVTNNSIVIGWNASGDGKSNGVIIGNAAATNGDNSISIGSSAKVRDAESGIAIGRSVDLATGANYAIGMGYRADINNPGAIGIGNHVIVSGDNSTAIGPYVSNSVNNSVRFGAGATSFIHFDDWNPAAGATTPDYYIEIELAAGRFKLPLESIP